MEKFARIGESTDQNSAKSSQTASAAASAAVAGARTPPNIASAAIGERGHKLSALGGRPSNRRPSPMRPQRDEADAEGGEPGEKLAEQQGVAIDRLRQDPAHRAPAELAVDRIEAERDDERHHKRKRHRKEAQKQKRVSPIVARIDRIAA